MAFPGHCRHLRNKDTLSPDAIESMKASANEFLRTRFQEDGTSSPAAPHTARSFCTCKVSKEAEALQFLLPIHSKSLASNPREATVKVPCLYPGSLKGRKSPFKVVDPRAVSCEEKTQNLVCKQSNPPKLELESPEASTPYPKPRNPKTLNPKPPVQSVYWSLAPW